jgi:alpha-N-acetylglucosaminidase
MTPETNDPAYLDASGKAIYRAMTSADPDAIWVMQGWIFYFEVKTIYLVT